MSFFGRLWASMSSKWPPGPGHDYWYGPAGSSGSLTHERAMQAAVVFACVKVISGSIGALPLKTYRRLGNGNKEEIPNHPLFSILHDQANEEHTAQEFREMMTAFALTRGTAFAEIIPGARGAVDQLVPLHPDEIHPVFPEDSSGRRRFHLEHRPSGGPLRRLLRDELFIFRALVMDRNGIMGIDPIMAHAGSIGARLSSQDYASRFFENDSLSGLILEHPTKFKDTDDKMRFIEAWQAASTGPNRHKARILEFGMKANSLGMTNEQGQFLETQKYQDVDITRIFNVPPHKVGILDRATFSNIEQQAIEFVSDTLMPWAVRWHQSIKRDLIRQPSIFAEHSFASLLRGDILNRYRAYAVGRNWGWLSANDIRRLETMNDIGQDGDLYLRPLNMVPAGDPAEPSGMGRDAMTEFEFDERHLGSELESSSDNAPPSNGKSHEH